MYLTEIAMAHSDKFLAKRIPGLGGLGVKHGNNIHFVIWPQGQVIKKVRINHVPLKNYLALPYKCLSIFQH